MRPTTIAGAVVGAAALLVLSPWAAVHAEPPVDFAGEYVVDEAGVLSGTSRVESALDDLFDRAGVSLFVVYVDAFDDPEDPFLWADSTAGISGFGPDDVLLAVAVDDRQYVLNDEVLDDAQFDRVAGRVETELRADDWEGAALEAADAIGDELAGDEPVDDDAGEGGGGIPILPILGGAAVVSVGAWGVSRLVRRSRGADPATPVAKLDQKGLDQRAGSLLVQLDDALETNEQELGFAQAQFGDAATKEFAAALASAKEQVKEAFAIRQQLDDATPETAEQKRELTTRIIQLCESASSALAAQSDAFEQLRQLETHAPEVLERVAAEHAELPARIEAADRTLAGLRSTFGDAAVAPVADNPAQARELAAFAATALAQAREALAAGKSSEGAVAVRGAQQSVGQAGQLVGAIDQLATDLPALAEKLDDAIEDARADLAEARAGLPSAPAEVAGPLRAAADEAERTLEKAAKRDPATAIAEIERTGTALHAALGGMRDAKAQAERAAAQLARVSSEAASAVRSAREFIATRRGAVGATARTRLNEAERQLTQSLAEGRTDPVAALASARQAIALASAALQSARGDVSAFDGGSSGPLGGGYGGAALGGILDGLFSGGGSSSGWWSSGGGGWSSGSSRPRPNRRPSGSSSRPRTSSRPRPSSGRRSRGGRF